MFRVFGVLYVGNFGTNETWEIINMFSTLFHERTLKRSYNVFGNFKKSLKNKNDGMNCWEFVGHNLLKIQGMKIDISYRVPNKVRELLGDMVEDNANNLKVIQPPWLGDELFPVVNVECDELFPVVDEEEITTTTRTMYDDSKFHCRFHTFAPWKVI